MAHGAGADADAARPVELDPRPARRAPTAWRATCRGSTRRSASRRRSRPASPSAAVARRLPVAAGGEGSVVSMRLPEDAAEHAALAAYVDGGALDGDPDGDPVRPLLIGGAPSPRPPSRSPAPHASPGAARRPAARPMARRRPRGRPARRLD